MVPVKVDFTSVSIFIASIIKTVSPSETADPTWTLIEITVPGNFASSMFPELVTTEGAGTGAVV